MHTVQAPADKKRRTAAEATVASLSAAEVEAAVKREGLTLVHSAVSKTGYQGVCAIRRRFKASGNQRSLGTFGSALEAALCFARFLGPDASAAAAAAGLSEVEAVAVAAAAQEQEVARQWAEKGRQDEARARRDAAEAEEAAAAARLQAGNRQLELLRLKLSCPAAPCEASVRALLADIARWPALGCLMPKLWALLREHVIKLEPTLSPSPYGKVL